MSEQLTQAEHKAEQRQHDVNAGNMLYWGTMIAGAVGGVVGGLMSIWETAYEQYKTFPRIRDFVKTRDQAKTVIWNSVPPITEQIKDYLHFDKEFMTHYKAELGRQGIHVADNPINLIKGTIQRLQINSGHFERGRIIFNAGLGALVTVGAVMALTYKPRLKAALEEADAQNQQDIHSQRG